MIIIGIDPGSHKTGYGIIKKHQDEIKLIECGCLITPRDQATQQRLKILNNSLTRLLNKHKPQVAAVEDIFFFKNHKTAVKVSQARGVILLALAKKNIPVHEPKPLEIKRALTGYGRADKSQIQKMVQYCLKLQKLPKSDDAADALAAAICCAYNLNYAQKIKNKAIS